jgi:hypothetical protein
LKNKKSCAISAQWIVSAAPVCKHRFEVMLPPTVADALRL